MDATHIHLMITHLPIFGTILGMLVLIFGTLKKDFGAKIASYGLFVISAVGAAIAFATGEGAEEKVEDLPGVMENIISQHESFAKYALISLIILGIVSLIAIFLNYKQKALSRTTAMVVLFISLVSFGLVAQTGYLGGQIRHTEIGNGAIQNTHGNEGGNEQKDDD
jgi:uncharacterized membrane protein